MYPDAPSVNTIQLARKKNFLRRTKKSLREIYGRVIFPNQRLLYPATLNQSKKDLLMRPSFSSAVSQNPWSNLSRNENGFFMDKSGQSLLRGETLIIQVIDPSNSPRPSPSQTIRLITLTRLLDALLATLPSPPCHKSMQPTMATTTVQRQSQRIKVNFYKEAALARSRGDDYSTCSTTSRESCLSEAGTRGLEAYLARSRRCAKSLEGSGEDDYHSRASADDYQGHRRRSACQGTDCDERSRYSLDENRLLKNRYREVPEPRNEVDRGSVRTTRTSTARSVRGGRRHPSTSTSTSRQRAVVFPHRRQSSSSQSTEIEIAPGQRARLRGAKEAFYAVKHDFFLPTQCAGCQTSLCCVMDASYVLCPECRVVGPLEGGATDGQGGCGLGFTLEVLNQWQQEIREGSR